MNNNFDVIVIGGGAAGFFTAINIGLNKPDFKILILEKTNKLLTKVVVSGGGRCNVTHHQNSIAALSKAYPRGKTFLKKAFNQFNVADLIHWFAAQGVVLKTEEDGRMFPLSNASSTIVNCFLSLAEKLKITIHKMEVLEKIEPVEMEGYWVKTNKATYKVPKVVVATGGHAKIGHFDYLAGLKYKIEAPCPSLFTFNLPKHPITALMGLSVSDAKVSIPSLKISWQAPLLITHWGLSGPAILVLSAICAKELRNCNYQFQFHIDFLPHLGLEELNLFDSNKQITNHKPEEIPQRLWDFFIASAEIKPSKIANQLAKIEKNKVKEMLKNYIFTANGKTTFKEEFVTCGGIGLEEISSSTMESKHHKGIYFAGEVMDIDAITGGYNFQAAWTTAFIAAKHITQS